jgi:hypothetical protein
MPDSFPIWRCFRSLPSDSEAASVSKYCVFSLSTLEIACDPETECIALIEREQADAWRWAVLNDAGVIMEGGQQSTQADAKCIAAEAFILMTSRDRSCK